MADAIAILAEAGRKPVPDALYGVRAARSGGTGALLLGRRLNGTVRFCPGAHHLDRALIAALDEDGRGSRERIYGANLGLRGDVYLAVGGFGPLSAGEDRHLWDRVKLAGYRAVTTAAAPVVTSSRTRGRARGGLADLLAGLRDQRSA